MADNDRQLWGRYDSRTQKFYWSEDDVEITNPDMRKSAVAAKLARGFTFTHDRFLDTSWEPGPGQSYVSAPHAKMVVTRVTSSRVWYTYAGDTHGSWVLPRAQFVRRFVPES